MAAPDPTAPIARKGHETHRIIDPVRGGCSCGRVLGDWTKQATIVCECPVPRPNDDMAMCQACGHFLRNERPADALATRAAEMAIEHRKIAERVADYVGSSRADNTVKAYARAWKGFCAWAESRDLPTLPTPPLVLAGYITHLAAEGKKVSTIEQVTAAVARHNLIAGHSLDKTARELVEAKESIRRRLGVRPDKKNPILADDLEKMLAVLQGDGLAATEKRALALTTWFGAFRRGEVVRLNLADVRFIAGDRIILTLRRSKTDQVGEGFEKGIEPTGGPVCCVESLRAWIAALADLGHIGSELPLFPRLNATKDGLVPGTRLSDRYVARLVKDLAERAGLDPTKVSGHSLRAGFATQAHESGADLTQIMAQTGHKDPKVAQGYIRTKTLFSRNATKGVMSPKPLEAVPLWVYAAQNGSAEPVSPTLPYGGHYRRAWRAAVRPSLRDLSSPPEEGHHPARRSHERRGVPGGHPGADREHLPDVGLGLRGGALARRVLPAHHR
jgi:integrase